MQTLADRYDVIRELGRGSFGQTLLAHDRENDRQVAIKLFDPKGVSDWKAQQLFEREAAVLGALRHHSVPEIHDYFSTEQEGTTVALLVMEYIAGASLQQMIDEHRLLDSTDVLHLLLELLSVLEYLHSRVPPILHRDIKPSNIIVRSDGAPVLVDFGSVRRVFLREEESGSTIAGTYGYMPYEQYMGQATPSSDLYALGATMLHLVTGRAPREFMGDDGSIDMPELPGDTRVAAVIHRMLRRSPADRFASAREARQALIVSTAPGQTRTALQPASPHAVAPLVQNARAVHPLSPARPRVIDDNLRTLLDALTPSIFVLVDNTLRPFDKPSFMQRATVAAFGVLTFGILPLIFYSHARGRRRRLARFLRHGVEGEGEVLRIDTEKAPHGENVAKVTYQFTVDGVLHRDADQVSVAVAQRWAVRDVVRILYLPEEDFRSVIISTR